MSRPIPIPLGIGAYSRPYGKLPEIRMENRFFEQVPTTAEQVALLSRPGTSLFLEVGDGPIRGMYQQEGAFKGDLFIVSGADIDGKLYRYSGGITTEIEGVVGGLTNRPAVAFVAIPGFEALFIADGLTLQYYTGSDEAGVHALQSVALPEDMLGAADLVSVAAHIIVVERYSHRWFYIRPGETEIDPLNFYSAESKPDEILHVLSVGGVVWFFGQSSTEAWYATGDAEDPFAPVQGRVFSQGVLAGTVAQFQDTIVCVGQDRIAYRITSGGPERISHHGIEEKLRGWQSSTLRASIDYRVTALREVQLFGHASVAEPGVTYLWEFFDGSGTEVIANPIHVFPTLGYHRVRLTVTDTAGNVSTDERMVNVTNALQAPLGFAGVWNRVDAANERIVLTWEDPSPYTAAQTRRVYRDGVLLANLAAGVTTYEHNTTHATVPLAGEVDNKYTVVYNIAAENGIAAEITVWSGPLGRVGVRPAGATQDPVWLAVEQSPTPGSYRVLFPDYEAVALFKHRVYEVPLGPPAPPVFKEELAIGQSYSDIASVAGSSVIVVANQVVEAFGVEDYTAFSKPAAISVQ